MIKKKTNPIGWFLVNLFLPTDGWVLSPQTKNQPFWVGQCLAVPNYLDAIQISHTNQINIVFLYFSFNSSDISPSLIK